MAHCSKCSKEVGCSCNLIGGLCVGCYAEQNRLSPSRSKKKTKKERYKAPPKDAPPLVGFEELLKDKGMSKEEKIRRINDIIESARQKYLT